MATKRVRTDAYRAWERKYKRALYARDPAFRARARKRTNEWRRKLWKTKRGKAYLIEKSLTWATANPEKYAASHRKAALKHRLKKYGLTLAQFEVLLKRQKDCCAICKTKISGTINRGPKRSKTIWPSVAQFTKNNGHWNIDHNHKTGKVRGLLCHHCNAGLGHFKDNPKLLKQALAYLS